MDQLWRQVGDMFGDLYQQTTEVIGQEYLNGICPSENSPTQPPLSLSIPHENDTVPLLVDAGAKEPHAIEMWNIHRNRALDLGNRFQRLYYDTCRDINTRGQCSSSKLLEKLSVRLQTSYNRTLEKWTTDMINRIPSSVRKKKKITRNGRTKGTRTPFNQEFRPFLEAFFDEKPFPSRAEKALLAGKSSMTFSQVNIWFQNRRARTKNNRMEKRQVNAVSEVAGLTERQHVDPDGATDTEREAISDDENLTTLSRCSSVTLCDDNTPFHCPYRPYTFPTVYPPDDKDYPFPRDPSGFIFVEPMWTRCHSSSQSSEIYSDTDVDELSEALKRLSIRDEISDNSGAGYISEHERSCNVMDPITTRPPSAPLPSLIRRLASSLQPYTCRLGRASSLKTNVACYSTERKDLPGSTCARSQRPACIHAPRAHQVNAISPSPIKATAKMNRLVPPTATLPSRLPMRGRFDFACAGDTLHPEPLQIASPDPLILTSAEGKSIIRHHDPISQSFFDLFPPIRIPVNSILD